MTSGDELNLDRSEYYDSLNVSDWSNVELDCDSSYASLDVDSSNLESDSLNLVLDLDHDSLWNVLDNST